jgi:glycosyltransferase involved in cell wall biosynthesis
LIEAAAMARPVITTDVPGCRAVVERDVSGFLCEVRSAESLATAIERFLALSPDQQQVMGEAGRAKMEREYDQAIVVQAYREAIASLVNNQRDQ